MARQADWPHIHVRVICPETKLRSRYRNPDRHPFDMLTIVHYWGMLYIMRRSVTAMKGFKMIQIVKGAQLSLDEQARLARHPLESASQIMRAVGLAFAVAGFIAFVLAAIGIIAVPSAHVGLTTTLVAGAVMVFGAVLGHQAAELHFRAVKLELHTTNADLR